jgi:hypothetical protein
MTLTNNRLLMVTSILLIIVGSIGIILGIIAALGVGALVLIADGSADMGLLTFASALVLLNALVSLVAGILGVVNAAKPNKMTTCIVFGVLSIVLTLLANFLSVSAGNDFKLINLLIGLVLPVLYLMGASQNKKRAAA